MAIRKEYLWGVGAFLALLCLMVVLVLLHKAPSLPSQNGQPHAGGILTISVSDPSALPKGTSALFVTFANASVYEDGAGWVYGKGYGPINLVGMGNRSTVISSVRVTNSSISASRLEIGTAYMIINGKRYAAVLQGGSVTTNLTGIGSAEGNTLLINLSLFALSSDAITNTVQLGYTTRGYLIRGTSGYLGQSSQIQSYAILAASPTANITVANTVIIPGVMRTNLKVTVVNHSNRSVSIGSVTLIGNESLERNSTAISNLANEYADQIMQKYNSKPSGASGSGSGSGSSLLGSLFNSSSASSSPIISQQTYSQALAVGSNLTRIISSNVSALASLAGPIPRALLGAGSSGNSTNSTALRAAFYNNIYNGLYNASDSQIGMQQSIDSVSFSPGDGCTTLNQYPEFENGTCSIPPNSAETFTYDGQVGLGNYTAIGLLPNSSYDVVVAGPNGAYANTTTDG